MQCALASMDTLSVRLQSFWVQELRKLSESLAHVLQAHLFKSCPLCGWFDEASFLQSNAYVPNSIILFYTMGLGRGLLRHIKKPYVP
ncbi:hypothetical protein SAMN04515695_2306 [Pseudovibrio sp. Tun.PSC04-5.I4]|nr:hypothetical protein SAMN04515695_2306 [Pseudovibrio sp. Tun.PSC04-5.I4]